MQMVIILFTWWAQVTFQGWETLSKLELIKSYDDLLGEEVEMPAFSKELKSFEGKIITLEGYVIPLEQNVSSDYFVLSRFPFNSCFFCGNAGPETVAEIYSNKKFDFKDQKVQVTGKLELNADDPLHLFYIISEASVKIMD